ncbi:unnamed protein product [Strongylus vulgaris]|uniref:Rab3 GTPase-activating protein catalytic subunit n=1 Tax=Strongylus vulgaris TaxID=40348 RepID=A0A3P7JXW0_STRVU|nr:unnamed protein product [Strongylus vulgaris]
MTEDMLDEYTRYLSSLDDGDSRTRAQLDVLCSDMQAFKAANPKCCLEDFIRWHSPKDWIEEEECLSERMQLPDNTWVKDDYVEALKLIKSTELLFVQYSSLLNKLTIGESDDSLVEAPNPEELYKFIIALIEDATSKRDEDRIVISRGVPIFGASNGTLGNAVRRMLERQDVKNGLLPSPSRKQYTIRWSVPRPTANSRVVPQRLFASIEQDEFRLCGAFTEDTVYT